MLSKYIYAYSLIYFRWFLGYHGHNPMVCNFRKKKSDIPNTQINDCSLRDKTDIPNTQINDCSLRDQTDTPNTHGSFYLYHTIIKKSLKIPKG
jgi:hypothetical protein